MRTYADVPRSDRNISELHHVPGSGANIPKLLRAASSTHTFSNTPRNPATPANPATADVSRRYYPTLLGYATVSRSKQSSLLPWDANYS